MILFLTLGMWTFLLENKESFQLLVFVLRSHWKNWIFDPDIIAKFPETPPWTYPTTMVNLTLSYAKKDQTDPSKYISLHNEVKDIFRDSFHLH